MKRQGLAVGLIVALCATATSRGEDITAEARIAAQQVVVNTCAGCHGRQGRSIAPKFPVLAGQHAGYLAAQLHAFKSQTRGDPDALGYMWGMSAPLDDEMINALAAYYAVQSPGHGADGNAAAIARGAEIYANGIAADGIPPAPAVTARPARARTIFLGWPASMLSTCSSSSVLSKPTCVTSPSCTGLPSAWLWAKWRQWPPTWSRSAVAEIFTVPNLRSAGGPRGTLAADLQM